jgi:hypothetical protein
MAWDGDDGDNGWTQGRGGRGRKKDDGHKIPNVKVIRSTAAAILVQGKGLSTDPFGMEDNKQEEWIPLSQLHDSTEIREIGDEGDLVISTWLATKKGLI